MSCLAVLTQPQKIRGKEKMEQSSEFYKKQEFNLFSDYSYKLTSEQKKIFDQENPYLERIF